MKDPVKQGEQVDVEGRLAEDILENPYAPFSPQAIAKLARAFLALRERVRLLEQREMNATEALTAMLDLVERHAGWCGYNKDAPGDSIINRAPGKARAWLEPPETVDDEALATTQASGEAE